MGLVDAISLSHYSTAGWRRLLWYLPAVAVVPFLWAVFPTDPHFPVEFAGYFQARAILADPIASYTYATPAESSSALHLHSWLAAPLLAIGYTQAGRLVSLLAAVGTAVLLGRLGRRLTFRDASTIAPVLLWAHPLFVVFASRWWTSSLSILLTTACVFATLRYLDTDAIRWYAGMLVLLALAITNHLWEATIALPMVAALAYRRRWRAAVGVASVTGVAVVIVRAIAKLQSTVGLAESYSIFSHPSALFSTRWLLRPPVFTSALSIAVSMTLPLVAFCAIYLAYKWWVEDDVGFRVTVLGSWLASGLSVLIFLPRGWWFHEYYAWGLLIPFALIGAWMIADACAVLARMMPINVSTAVTTATVVLAVAAITFALVSQVGIGALGGPPPAEATVSGFSNDEISETAAEIQAAGVTDADAITFVGWSGGPPYFRIPAISRLLVLSDVSMQSSDELTIVGTKAAAGSECAVYVARNGSDMTVSRCL